MGHYFLRGFPCLQPPPPQPPQATFRTITQERVAWLISYFFGIAGWVRRGALSILVVIRFPIWPRGHLGFSSLLHNLRSTWSINFIFYGCNGMEGRCPIDFSRDPTSNIRFSFGEQLRVVLRREQFQCPNCTQQLGPLPSFAVHQNSH
jgi:hypothetical protein